jgi:PTS system mannose-specific IID component
MSLPRSTLAHVAARSLLIQAGFSPEAMQTLGLLYALDPAWRRLYPDEARRQEAARRHLSPFNTHPYAAAAIVGGILHLEERLARGEATEAEVARFKQTLMGPLAAMGDGFYWLSLRPAVAALAVALVPLLGPWSALLLLLGYNAVHLSSRLWLFVQGYRHGDGVVLALSRVKVPMWSQRLRALAALAAGAAGTWLAMDLHALIEAPPWWHLASVGLGLLATVLGQWPVPRLALLYATAAVATLAGALW